MYRRLSMDIGIAKTFGAWCAGTMIYFIGGL